MKRIILLSVFAVLSCKNYEEKNLELENELNTELIKELNLNCIIPGNVKDTNYVLTEKNFQFMDSLALLERKFVEANLLSDTTKTGYRSLIKKIKKENTSLKNAEKIGETELFGCLKIISTKYILFKKSPMQIISNQDSKGDLEKIIDLYDKITENGGVNVLDYYLNNIDLNNRTYRLLFCYIIYNELLQN